MEKFYRRASKGIVKAVARVQVLLEIKTKQYLNVRLKSFVNNDQGDAAFIVRFLSAGDLVIRDLGYFVLDVRFNNYLCINF